MEEFRVLPDGRVVDLTAEGVVQRHLQACPWADRSALYARLTLVRASLALNDELSPHWQEFGLSGARFNVLRLLDHSPAGQLSLSEISQGLNSTTTNATKMVEGLERDGLVRRECHPSDRRVTLVILTGEGRRRFEAMLPHLLRQLGELFAGLSAEEKVLLAHLLTKLRLSAVSRFAKRSEAAAALLSGDHAATAEPAVPLGPAG